MIQDFFFSKKKKIGLKLKKFQMVGKNETNNEENSSKIYFLGAKCQYIVYHASYSLSCKET